MIKMIVCTTTDGAIGRNNDLLFFNKNDLQNFKELTTGGTVVMGSNTWDSLPRKPLPNRTNVVLTQKDESLFPEDVVIINTIDELYEMGKEKDIWVMGGAMLYNTLIEADMVDEAHVTLCLNQVDDADTFIKLNLLNDNLEEKEFMKSLSDNNSTMYYLKLTRSEI